MVSSQARFEDCYSILKGVTNRGSKFIRLDRLIDDIDRSKSMFNVTMTIR